ncbi:sensor histidine kinase [Bacteriovorax sp. Seq25_V]|uniref:sensor histidine kinase n=1 Tax=Bacteriovorax sp. Seq25_V TaxID=1201288 RepID=UPI00038A344A|nr:HAMP domain-containing sensor histidine kinase [Bacteriovorax sp. Seq25_V]EQC43519.1 GHKL domain protein [Bacteriovorax sp. Seq25_V]
MENQSNSSNDRKRKDLTLYIDKKANHELAFIDSSQFSINSKKSISQYTLRSNSLEFNSVDNSEIYFNSEDELKGHLINISNISLELEEKSTLENLEEITKRLFKSSTHINQVIANFNKIPNFKHYSFFQVFIHEKGQSNVHSFFNDQHEIITVASYNNIFSKIKKSKNKHFDLKDIGSDDIHVIGSFLAKELEYTDLSIVVIASRGDLFSTQKEEKEFFSNLIAYSKIKFSLIAKNTLIFNQKTQIEKIIKDFPIYLSITSKLINLESDKKAKNSTKTVSNEYVTITYETTEDSSNDAELFHHARLMIMGELLNTLSHELSNPLFGISISTEMLSYDSHDKDQDILSTIKEVGLSASRCQMIIKSFSELYNENDHNTKINLRSLLTETITLTKSESKFFKKNINFINTNEDIELLTNPTYLSQIIFNLVINSSQSLKESNLPSKEIHLDVSDHENYLTISIRDNGPGIPTDKKADIFNPFVTTKETGTGLGLSICKRLCEKINANISLVENLPGWTEFLITIQK